MSVFEADCKNEFVNPTRPVSRGTLPKLGEGNANSTNLDGTVLTCGWGNQEKNPTHWSLSEKCNSTPIKGKYDESQWIYR